MMCTRPRSNLTAARTTPHLHRKSLTATAPAPRYADQRNLTHNPDAPSLESTMAAFGQPPPRYEDQPNARALRYTGPSNY